eukprot:30513_1
MAGKPVKPQVGKPKPILSGFMYFCEERRAIERTKEFGLKLKQSQLGREWKQLNADEKEKYENIRLLKKKEFEIENEKYLQSKKYNDYLNELELWKKDNDKRPNTRSYSLKNDITLPLSFRVFVPPLPVLPHRCK